ncbi:MAG: hypothetical protein ACUZ8O_12755 [Candidatus Anammoxibacter sp.]
MKINRFGINLDEGLALTEETLNKFYVPCFEDEPQKIVDWLKDNTIETPLLFGGQIGSGKSTLITKVFSDKSLKPDITLKFDKEGLNLDEGDFLSIVLAGFIKKAIELKSDLSFSNLPAEVFKLHADDWHGIVNMLCPESFSMKSFETKISARKRITKKAKYIAETISRIGDVLKDDVKSPLFIFAAGIDKYDVKFSAFKISLESSVTILSNYKTMFEVNAVHLFLPNNTSPFSSNSEKVFIQTVSDEKIIEILQKRMGIYAEPIKTELELITKWSGGNPRQAIRLLTHYQSTRKNKGLDKTGRLANAIKRTTDDLFAYSTKPSSDLIKIISRDKIIETSFFNLPGDKESALQALYGNWIFITQGSINGAWPAIVNPLVKPFFKNKKYIVAEPEQKLLSQYAEINDMSPIGLGFNMLEEDGSQKDADKILQDFFSMGLEEPLPLKLTEILDIISAALLSNDRKDRIIVGFKDKNILDAARAYLFAKANSYEYQRFEHRNLLGGKDKEPIHTLEETLELDTDILSLEFAGKWTERQLDILDKSRDRFINYQMLWWIPLEDLKDYLPHWVQLRELFEFFILEDELLGSLSVKDIESDLAFYEDLVESEESSEYSMVKNLKIVLKYLKENRGSKNG